LGLSRFGLRFLKGWLLYTYIDNVNLGPIYRVGLVFIWQKSREVKKHEKEINQRNIEAEKAGKRTSRKAEKRRSRKAK
jgi:hypothetical protein